MTREIQTFEQSEAVEVNIDYTPFEKQEIFHGSKARYRLFGGAAGPGKSTAVIYEAAAQCLESDHAIDGVLFRRTFPELEQSLIKKFLEKIPGKLYVYNSQKHLVTFKRNKSTLLFTYCKREDDVYKYQSVEWDFIGIDELTHFTEFQVRYLLTRLRTTKENTYANFFAATNPGNIGHVWVRGWFVRKDKLPPGESPADYDYTHSTVDDNPIIMERDPEYVKRLNALPEVQKQALRWGNWDIFQGQFFSEWLDSVHVIEPFTPPADWKRIRAIDYGSTAPFCCLWAAINPNPDIPPVDAAGRVRHELKGVKVIIYKEYYYPFPDPFTGEVLVPLKTDTQNFEAVLDMSQGEEVSYTVMDPSTWGKSETKQSIADTARATGLICQPADNDRVGGWSNVRNYLNWKEGIPGDPLSGRQPLVKVTSNCYHLIRTLPALIHHETKLEDIADDQEDHAPDTIRYLLRSLKAKLKVSSAHKQEREAEREEKRDARRRPMSERLKHSASTYGMRRR